MEEFSASGFDDFSIEMEDFEVRHTRKFDRIWKVGDGGSICCIPLLHDGVVYFGCLNHMLYAVDVSEGTLVWKFQAYDIFMESSPVYWEGMVFAGSYDRYMYALDAKTGKLVWRFETSDKVNSMPFIHNGMLYFGGKDRNVYCLDARSGRLAWKFATQDEIASSPAIHEGMLYIGSFDRNFYCLDADTGRLLWKFSTQGEVYHANMPLIHDGKVYFVSFDNNLYAVKAEDGKLIWKLRIAEYGTVYAPVLSGDRMYVPTRDGTLVCVTLDGKVAWKFSRMHVPSIPAINDGRIYIGFEDQNLYCLDMEGNLIWKFETQGSIWLTAVFSGNSVIFPSWDCNLYCIDSRDASVIWKFRTDGSPSYVPPANEEFEVVIRRKAERAADEDAKGKRYDFKFDEEDNTSTYKSRITYQVSTQYAAKGKYQIDSDEEEF